MSKQKFGLTAKKSIDFSDWYTQVLTKGEILDYYEVKGCYILRPNGYHIWKVIQKWFTEEIEKIGVEECMFPMLVPKSFLEKEESHIADFSPEVAWITKCGNEVLHEPVAIRPTSETVMYASFAKWIKSHRDLPLKLNQWCNVLRWEIKGCTPLIRSKEIFWQEGHTVHMCAEEAHKEVYHILDLYAKMYKDILAVPVIKGLKSESEKFAGSDFSSTVEAFIPGSGRGIQAGTSHHLGQNFSKMFDIQVQTDNDQSVFVYQNSWGVTTRSIGISIMLHSDDKGLVLPPRACKTQVVIVPCGLNNKSKDEDKKAVDNKIFEISNMLSKAGIRTHIDDRNHVTVGYKFNHWEIRGVPLRIEIGMMDIQNNEVSIYKRNTGEKIKMKMNNETFCTDIDKMLKDIHTEMYTKAKNELDCRIKYVDSYDQLLNEINNKNLVMVPWCLSKTCEEDIKKRSTIYENNVVVQTGVKCLCIPFETKDITHKKCVICEKGCDKYALFGRSY